MNERFDGAMFGPGQPCFGCSPDHAIGFHLEFTREGDDVITRMTPGEQYQGPPGIMHGGLVATLADEVGAWACIVFLGKFGFTVSLSARFTQAVRIGIETMARGRILKASSRFVDVEVVVSQDERSCFTSEFRFLLLDEGGAERMLGRPLPDAWKKFARGAP
jgi:acyl-coenzyme A thioesterase PaaI-like protein